jgi:two-component system sensor histidine kinase HydH
VSISSDELRQVLLNLCTNAQEAMPRSGSLVVSTVAEPENAILLVRDSGTGMAPEVQQRLFDPFFTTKPRGSGLGLTLVRRVVTGAGGGVFFESEPQRGTTFRIVLPRAVPTAVPAQGSDSDFSDMTALRDTLNAPMVQSPPSDKGS